MKHDREQYNVSANDLKMALLPPYYFYHFTTLLGFFILLLSIPVTIYFVITPSAPTSAESLDNQSAWQRYDLNGDGYISEDDIQVIEDYVYKSSR